MSAKTEPNKVGDWLLDEFGAPNFCREEITVVSGQNLPSGAVLGKITSGGKYAEYDNDAATGVEVAAGILLHAVDATSADKAGIAILRGPCIVSKAGLTWKSTQHAVDIAAGLADLLALKFPIVAREGV
jgi:hypothetical protein